MNGSDTMDCPTLKFTELPLKYYNNSYIEEHCSLDPPLYFSDQCFKENHKLRALSNFHESKIKYKNKTYKSAEHLYQSLKCVKPSDKVKICDAATPKEARIRSRFVETHNLDEKKKFMLMYKILQMKFAKPKMYGRLMYWNEFNLIYLNYWHDTFWGVCACSTHKRTGQNHLGRILMHIRDITGDY